MTTSKFQTPSYDMLLQRAFDLSLLTPKEALERDGALAVGVIIVDANGNLHESFSGADSGLGHAEELAFRGIDAKSIDCKDGMLFCTHEPCKRRSDPQRTSCADLIVRHRIKTVVYSIREEKADFQSDLYLRECGINVVRIPRLDCRSINRFNFRHPAPGG